MDAQELQRYFNEAEKLDPRNGYAERNVEWFKTNILPDILCLGLRSPLLDAGCGCGYFTAHYAESFENVVGIDFSENRINEARRYNGRPNARYEVCDLGENCVQFPQHFNSIVSSAMIQHVVPESRSRVFKNLSEMSVPGAILVLYDEIDTANDLNWDGFYGRISPAWLRLNVSDFWNVRSCTRIAIGLQGEQIHRIVMQRVSA